MHRAFPAVLAVLAVLLPLCAGLPVTLRAQAPDPLALTEDADLTRALHDLVEANGLGGAFDVGADGTARTSLMVIELGGEAPAWGAVNPDDFLYPASVYKMYVAAEVLRQVRAGRYDLAERVGVAPHNAVDTVREVPSDPRPLLQAGDTVTVGYLLDLMITRSDNTAANVLIDQAGRPAIDALLHRYGWQGSEVTRKFLPRRDEDPGYADVPGTVTSGRHAAEFLYRAATDRLAGPWVSRRLMVLLGGQLDDTKLAAGLPRSALFYHKTGWWSYWTHDAGVVADGDLRYVVACLTPVPEADARPRLRRLAADLHALLQRRAAP